MSHGGRRGGHRKREARMIEVHTWLEGGQYTRGAGSTLGEQAVH